MSREKKLRFVPYDSIEKYALEAWLDEQAQSGWQLIRFYGAYAAFHREEPKNTRYRLDILSSEKYDMELEIHEDAAQQGWEYVCDFAWHEYSVYRSDDPDAVELHSDPAVLRKLMDKKIAITMIALGLLLAWLVRSFFLPDGLIAMFRSSLDASFYIGNDIYRLAATVVFLIFWIIFVVMMLSALLHARKDLAQGCSTGRRKAWIRPTVQLVLTILAIVALFLLIGPGKPWNTDFISLQEWQEPLPIKTWGEFAPEEYRSHGNDDFLFENDSPFAERVIMLRQKGNSGEKSLFYDVDICQMKTPELRQKLFDAYVREFDAKPLSSSGDLAYIRTEYYQVWIFQSGETVIRVFYNGSEDLTQLEAGI